MAGTSVEDHLSPHEESHSSKKKQDYVATKNKQKGSPDVSPPTHHKARSSYTDVDLMLAEDLASQRLIPKAGLDISPAGIVRAKAYAATQSGKADYAKARYAKALDTAGIRPGKPKRFTFDDVMEAAGTMNALREATVYPFEHPRELAKGMYKLGTVATKAMMHQYTVQDYVDFGMSVKEAVSRWRADLNSSDAYTRGYARGEAFGLFVPGTGAEIGVAKLGMFAGSVRKAQGAVKVSSHNPAIVKSVKEMALELKAKIKKNSISFRTSNKSGHIDLDGAEHFDKISGKKIPTPHVQVYDVHIGPAGKISISRKSEQITLATKGDIRIARRLAEQQGLLAVEENMFEKQYTNRGPNL